MSELINNSEVRKARLKELILRLHRGEDPENVRQELMESLRTVPYGEVVEVEQELISEGLPEEEVLRLCDIHGAVLHGNIDLSSVRIVPEGHPVDVFRKENLELRKVTAQIKALLQKIMESENAPTADQVLSLRSLFNQLYDVDKHYQRKEYLLFPFLEKLGITGPPMVMWGKHDEIRELIKGSMEILRMEGISPEEFRVATQMVLFPAIQGVDDMTQKEEEILLPMALDKLTEKDWYEIHRHSLEIGFCLYDPPYDWVPDWAREDPAQLRTEGNQVMLPSGGFTTEELMAILNTLPVDITFVDRNDRVKYFSQSSHRIFQRNRAILNRDVRLCHPPASVHIVDKILNDFRSGKQHRAPFWINLHGRFIHIEYFALRDEHGEYLGTLEVSQDLTHYRSLQGEQRILNYQ